MNYKVITPFMELYEELNKLLNEEPKPVIAFLLPNTKNGYLSNWYQSQISIYGQEFSSGEQAFMWAKADTFMDNEIKAQIMQTNDPKKLKALGRKIKNFDEAVWSSVRVTIMAEIVTAKFEQNTELMKQLLATEDAILVEANSFDKFWGCGLKASDATIKDPTRWPGKNILGKILMDIRATNSTSINEDVSLTEAKQVGLVSYGVKGTADKSSISILDIILQSGKIKSSEVQGGLYNDSSEDAFVSTSRDLLSHIKNNRQRPVGIILDGDKLSDRYKIRPINWATLELNKDISRLNLKALYEYTNEDDPNEKTYKVQFASYGSFLITSRVFDILERIMQCYNATETINRRGEMTTLGATHGFVGNDHIGSKGRPRPGNWRITKGYFYNVPNGGGVNISKGTFNKYRSQLDPSGELNINDDTFISELVRNKVLDEAEERLLQKVVYTFAPTSYKKDGTLKKNAKPIQVDTYFDISGCVKLILLPIAYKKCWDTDGAGCKYCDDKARSTLDISKLQKKDLDHLDLLKLKVTVKSKGLADKIFWVDADTTNVAVRRALY